MVIACAYSFHILGPIILRTLGVLRPPSIVMIIFNRRYLSGLCDRLSVVVYQAVVWHRLGRVEIHRDVARRQIDEVDQGFGTVYLHRRVKVQA